MSILDRVTIERDGVLSQMRVGVSILKDKNDYIVMPHGYKYKMGLSVDVYFRSPGEDHPMHNRRVLEAERVLLHALYRDSLSILDSAIHLMNYDDIEGALSELSKLRDELIGVRK